MEDHLDAAELGISFNPKFREYGLRYPDGVSVQEIRFCPWCGTRLPQSLRTAWFNELERLGLEPEDDLPERLLSDEWWRVH
jgi:hypothetical protein